MAQILAQLLKDKRVIVCVGAGGVGKTTISAALGVAAAMQGRRTLVLTVDPARRLANALGLQSFDEQIQTLSIADFAAQGVTVAAPLDVAMLDVKSTFDRTVVRLAPDEESGQAILDNRFYQQGSTVLAGSQEYMAMARLYEVATETAYDLIILDTPPSAHALDFLDAPQRMINLFGSTTFRMLLGSLQRSAKKSEGEPSGMFSKRSLVMRGLSRFTSAESFGSLLHFFALLSTTFDGFIQTAEDVMTLLRSQRTAFLLVAACDEPSTRGAEFLAERLRDEEMEIGGWVLNRVQSYSDAPLRAPQDTLEALRAAVTTCTAKTGVLETGVLETGVLETSVAETGVAERSSDSDLAAADTIFQVGEALARMARRDHDHLRRLREAVAGAQPVIAVPRSRQEPTQLRELAALAQILVYAEPATTTFAPPADLESPPA